MVYQLLVALENLVLWGSVFSQTASEDQCSKQELQIRTAFTGQVRRLTVLLPESSGLLSSSSQCSFQLITMMALGGDSEAQEGKSMRARCLGRR